MLPEDLISEYSFLTAPNFIAALMVFGSVTGVDPRSLGNKEIAAMDLGLDPRLASKLRAIAAEELGFK